MHCCSMAASPLPRSTAMGWKDFDPQEGDHLFRRGDVGFYTGKRASIVEYERLLDRQAATQGTDPHERSSSSSRSPDGPLGDENDQKAGSPLPVMNTLSDIWSQSGSSIAEKGQRGPNRSPHTPEGSRAKARDGRTEDKKAMAKRHSFVKYRGLPAPKQQGTLFIDSSILDSPGPFEKANPTVAQQPSEETKEKANSLEQVGAMKQQTGSQSSVVNVDLLLERESKQMRSGETVSKSKQGASAEDILSVGVALVEPRGTHRAEHSQRHSSQSRARRRSRSSDTSKEPILNRGPTLNKAALSQQHEVPDRWGLEGTVGNGLQQGTLWRLSRRFPRRWLKETMVVAQSFLISLAKENPPLIQTSIALRAIRTVEIGKKADRFTIAYLVPKKNGVESKVIQVIFRAESEEKCREWVNEIMTQQRMAMLRVRDSFVQKDAAMTRVTDLHSTLRNGALMGLIASVTNIIQARHFEASNDAFMRLRMFAVSTSLKQYSKQLKQNLDITLTQLGDARDKAENSLRYANLQYRAHHFVVHLEECRRRQMSRAMLTWMQFSIREYHETYMLAAKDTVHSIVERTATTEALTILHWRRQHIRFVLDRCYRRQLRDCFVILRASAVLSQGHRDAQRRSMERIVAMRTAKHEKCLSLVIARWSVEAGQRRLQAEMIMRHITGRTSLRGYLRRWLTMAVKSSENDLRAFDLMYNISTKVAMRQKAWSLHNLNRNAKDKGRLQALQNAANLAAVNEELVAQFDALPRERACQLMVLWIRSHALSVFAAAFRGLRRFVLDKRYVLKCTPAAVDVTERLQKRRRALAFMQIVKAACHRSVVSSKKSQASLRIYAQLTQSHTRSLWNGWRCLLRVHAYGVCQLQKDLVEIGRQTALQRTAYNIVTWVERLHRSRMHEALLALRAEMKLANIIAGLRNVQLMERLCTLAQISVRTTLARSFSRLSEHIVKLKKREIEIENSRLQMRITVETAIPVSPTTPAVLASVGSSTLEMEVDGDLRAAGVSVLPTRLYLSVPRVPLFASSSATSQHRQQHRKRRRLLPVSIRRRLKNRKCVPPNCRVVGFAARNLVARVWQAPRRQRTWRVVATALQQLFRVITAGELVDPSMSTSDKDHNLSSLELVVDNVVKGASSAPEATGGLPMDSVDGTGGLFDIDELVDLTRVDEFDGLWDFDRFKRTLQKKIKHAPRSVEDPMSTLQSICPPSVAELTSSDETARITRLGTQKVPLRYLSFPESLKDEIDKAIVDLDYFSLGSLSEILIPSPLAEFL